MKLFSSTNSKETSLKLLVLCDAEAHLHAFTYAHPNIVTHTQAEYWPKEMKWYTLYSCDRMGAVSHLLSTLPNLKYSENCATSLSKKVNVFS